MKDAVTTFLSQFDFGSVKTPFGSFIPVDADVSPFDNLGSSGGETSRDPVTVVFRVTVRTMDADGQALLLEQVDVDTWWTSLGEAPETVIRLYEDHATSEQFHSELKNDMDLEPLPSRSFAVNELFLTLGMIAYNTLRLITDSGDL